MRMKAILLLTATLIFVVSPYFAPSFRGYEPSDFPIPPIDPAIQPAGWAFAIWGVIYAALLAMAGWGLWREADNPVWDGPRWGMFISLALGASWLQVATAQPVLATVQIWVMAAAAIWAMTRLVHRPPALLAAPIGLYAGWLTAASGVGTGVVLIGYGIGSELAVTLALLTLVAAVALWVTAQTDPPVSYPLGVIWALFGIFVENWGDAVVMLTAGVYALALAALTVRPWLPRPA